MMTLDHTGETTTLTYSDDINERLTLENINQHSLPDFQSTVSFGLFFDFHGDFAQEFHRRQIVFAKVSAHRLSNARFLYEFNQPDLSGNVPVLGGGLVLCNHARASLKNSGRTYVALVIEELRHADFLS